MMRHNPLKMAKCTSRPPDHRVGRGTVWGASLPEGLSRLKAFIARTAFAGWALGLGLVLGLVLGLLTTGIARAQPDTALEVINFAELDGVEAYMQQHLPREVRWSLQARRLSILVLAQPLPGGHSCYALVAAVVPLKSTFRRKENLPPLEPGSKTTQPSSKRDDCRRQAVKAALERFALEPVTVQVDVEELRFSPAPLALANRGRMLHHPSVEVSMQDLEDDEDLFERFSGEDDGRVFEDRSLTINLDATTLRTGLGTRLCVAFAGPATSAGATSAGASRGDTTPGNQPRPVAPAGHSSGAPHSLERAAV
jgi:hypothetical protein